MPPAPWRYGRASIFVRPRATASPLCSLERPGGNAASNLGGNLLEAQAYRIKRSQLQERTGLHRKDAAFLRAFAAVRNYRLIVDQSPMDFCGCC